MNLLPRKFYFDDFLDDFLPTDNNWNNMKCDIYEKEGNYNIIMDVPGLNKEDIKIDCTDGYLTIEANKNEESTDEGKNYIRKERTSGQYKRQFYVGNVDTKNIKAEFKHGVLKIIVPKQEEKAGKNIIEIE